MQETSTRREFCAAVGAAGALAMATSAEGAAQGGGGSAGAPGATSSTGLPLRALGKTGEQVSCLGLGGWHIGAIRDRKEAVALMHAAIDEGLTFFDNAWDYHAGGSEEVMGQALAEGGKRKRVFLMTKNCERDYVGSMRCLEESLARLRTDYLDLWQFHEINYDNDPDWLMERGAVRAALEAKKAGKVRFIGFTGHKHPDIHLRTLSLKVPWDTVQMPINILDGRYRSFAKQVLPVCRKRGIGVIGMKSMGGGAPHGQFLAPGATGLTAEQCIRYALSVPVSTLVVGMLDREQLKKNVAIARDGRPLEAEEEKRLLDRLHSEASDGRHELFKSTTMFDGPHHRKQHGFAP